MRVRSLRVLAAAAVVALVGSGCSYITRSSVASDGTQVPTASGGAYGQFISGNGRYTLFSSFATNLVVGDTNGKADVFRHDNVTGATVRVNLDARGHQIAGDSGPEGISDDGNRVLFSTNVALVAADQDAAFDFYARDVSTGAVQLVSLRPDGTQVPAPNFVAEPAMSGNGRYVAFYDQDPGTPFGKQILVRDITAGTTTALGTRAFKNGLSISADGKHVIDARACDPTCTTPAILEVYDWQGVTYPHVPSNSGVDGQSADGRYLLWYPAQGMSRFDRVTGTSTLVAACCESFGTMSGDGRVVVFPSINANLVPGDTNNAPDYFAVDVLNGAIRRVNVDATARQADNGDANENLPPAVVDTAGRYTAFTSQAANLVGDDTNATRDVFTADAAHPMPTSMSPSSLNRRAQHAAVVVAGGFLLDSSTFDLGPGITVESVTHQADGSQRVVVSVSADAATGKRDVSVSVPGAMGAANGTCFGCLTIG
jgi:hypothetical protein